MQIKTTRRCHLTPIRMAMIKKNTNNKCGEKETLVHFWWECKLVQPLWKTYGSFLKTKNRTTIYPSNSTPGYISKKTKNSHLKRYIPPTFIAALFTIAKTWKQPRYPSTDEWIKKMWCIYAMEYYSGIKNNEILPFAATWLDLEGVMVGEISQTEKGKYCMISLICGI